MEIEKEYPVNKYQNLIISKWMTFLGWKWGKTYGTTYAKGYPTHRLGRDIDCPVKWNSHFSYVRPKIASLETIPPLKGFERSSTWKLRYLVKKVIVLEKLHYLIKLFLIYRECLGQFTRTLINLYTNCRIYFPPFLLNSISVRKGCN